MQFRSVRWTRKVSNKQKDLTCGDNEPRPAGGASKRERRQDADSCSPSKSISTGHTEAKIEFIILTRTLLDCLSILCVRSNNLSMSNDNNLVRRVPLLG